MNTKEEILGKIGGLELTDINVKVYEHDDVLKCMQEYAVSETKKESISFLLWVYKNRWEYVIQQYEFENFWRSPKYKVYPNTDKLFDIYLTEKSKQNEPITA